MASKIALQVYTIKEYVELPFEEVNRNFHSTTHDSGIQPASPDEITKNIFSVPSASRTTTLLHSNWLQNPAFISITMIIILTYEEIVKSMEKAAQGLQQKKIRALLCEETPHMLSQMHCNFS